MPRADSVQAHESGVTSEAPLQLLYELRDFDRFPLAKLLQEARPKIYEQCKTIQKRVRDFGKRYLVDHVEGWDQKAASDHDFVPWSAIDGGLQFGMLSMNIPPAFGGEGFGMIAGGLFTEELSTIDAGIYVIYGSHWLAMAALAASLDTRVMYKLTREITDGEKNGQAVLLALGYTEPGGGSDVEDRDEIKTARIASRWTRVAGGYRVNARKVFISNGSFARYVVLTAFGDPKNPLETTCAFVIPNDAPGFSVGRVEHKLGQRLCAAAEIICDDVFVPDENAILTTDAGRMIDTVLSLTRGPVGAMATGITRGALERTLVYLSQKRVRGHWLFEEQWVQLALADMICAVQTGRGLYMDASLATERWGLPSLGGRQLPLPEVVTRSRLFASLVTHPNTIARARASYDQAVSQDQLSRVVALGSASKLVCSDLAVKMTMKAMEILGEDANDPKWGVEKCMRDAKLTQIFEGTNQVCRLHVARSAMTRVKPEGK